MLTRPGEQAPCGNSFPPLPSHLFISFILSVLVPITEHNLFIFFGEDFSHPLPKSLPSPRTLAGRISSA